MGWYLCLSQMIHLARALSSPGFCHMKQLGILLLPMTPLSPPLPPPTPPQHFIRFPWQLTGTHSYSWVDRGYVRDNYVPPPRTQHNGLTRCWVYRPLNHESNPPSDWSLYLLVGLLDSTFFPNSNSGLIKMLYYQTRGPLLPEEAGLSKKLK